MCVGRKCVNRLILQWHVTNRCNLRCKHCYQEDYNGDELTLDEIKKVIAEYVELLKTYAEKKGIEFIRGHINVTGGEPFVREDFLKILEEFSKNKKYFSYGILTNGTFITDEIAKKLVELNVSHVQVSMEGDKPTHDSIRGTGSFDKTMSALKILNKYNINSHVSFTAHKQNYKDFSHVCKHARKAKASKVWTDRLVPMGSGKEMSEQLLSKDEALEFFGVIMSEKNKTFRNKISNLEVYSNRSLQFLKSGEHPYNCSAGDSLVTILENGDVLSCRRMPIPTENVLNYSLSDIYYNNKVFKDLRQENIPEECKSCVYASKCKGGSKCISYAIYNDYTKPDPSCPILKSKL